jgi:hypothetical protein
LATKSDVTGFVGILAASYPNFNLTQETIVVYQKTLADIEPKVLEAAILHLVTTSKFFPTIAEIREAAFSIMTNERKIPSAFEAWEEAINHCIKGNYKDYSHPLIERAVNIIGIDYWRNMTYDDEMATRAQFFKIYETLLQREKADLKMLPQIKEFSENYQLGIGREIKKLAEKLEVK